MVLAAGCSLRNPFWSGFYQEAHNHFHRRRTYMPPSAAELRAQMLHHYRENCEKSAKLEETRNKLIEARKELSAIKRGQRHDPE